MSRYNDVRNRFMKWSPGDLFYSIPEVDVPALEPGLTDAVEADVNAAVASAIDRLEVLPTDCRATIALEVVGDGAVDGFTRLVSLDDLLSALDGHANSAELRAAMADRLEELARGLR